MPSHSMEARVVRLCQMSALLALVSSVLWGTADFLGGLLTKRFKAVAVTGASQAFGLLTAIILVIATGGFLKPNLHWNGFFLPGVAAGFLGFFGLMSYYSGLATGRMGVVAPVSSLSAVIPLIYSFSIGEHPHSLQIVGMIVALLGAFCASGPEITQGLPIKPTLFGLGAALGFGGALVFMAKGSKVDSLMTMTSMRFATVSICALLALRFRSVGGFKKNDLLLLITIGSGDFLANYLLGIATTKGLISIAMVLGSLFPIVPVLLAFHFLSERLHKVQYLGVVLAVTGVALISL